jgi:acyl-CoA synthetase (NDP forming)
MVTPREHIDDFLAQETIALVGVSRKPQALSRKLFEQWRKEGKQVIPVNPEAEELGGVRAYGRISDVQPLPPAALIMVDKQRTPELVEQCRALGVPRVWVHFASTPKGGIDAAPGAEEGYLIQGECPFMFLPEAGFIHRLHAGILKLTGRYPK